MKKTVETLSADIRRRLRREGASLAIILAAIAIIAAMAVAGIFPAGGDDYVTSFASGFLIGLLAFAAGFTVKQIRKLRGALSDDTALRALLAAENDELETYLAREVSRTFVHLIPPLSAVIVVVVSALVGREAMLSAVGTLLFLCTALLVVRFVYKRRLMGPETE